MYSNNALGGGGEGKRGKGGRERDFTHSSLTKLQDGGMGERCTIRSPSKHHHLHLVWEQGEWSEDMTFSSRPRQVWQLQVKIP